MYGAVEPLLPMRAEGAGCRVHIYVTWGKGEIHMYGTDEFRVYCMLHVMYKERILYRLAVDVCDG